MRSGFDLDDSYVLIYSGKLDRPWHKAEFIFKLASALMEDDHRLFFICLTPNIRLAESLVGSYQIPRNRILLKYEEFENLNAYYNGADLGLMIRDDIPTNHVASPTKLPEYLLSGLPVMISRNIGDYSEFVHDYNLGFIVENKIQDMAGMFQAHRKSGFDRVHISKTASQNLSKQSKIMELVNLYGELS
jgi:hypothetical protein